MRLKKFLSSGLRYLFDGRYRFQINANLGMYDKMEDKAFLKRKFWAIRGTTLDLANPETFSEKLQWLKLYDRNPEYVKLVDKVAVRQYVADTIGEKYLIPLLGIWDSPEDIDFNALPEQFVLKCNHNSGLGMYICTDKAKLDKKHVIAGLNKGLQENYYLKHREWPYRDVPRKILCEEYLSNGGNSLADYKIHCFHGEPKFILVCQDRFSRSGLKEDFFTTEWEHMNLKRPHLANAANPIPRPSVLEEMLELARKLAGKIPFARIDFYTLGECVFFGEITLYPASGFTPFQPERWDEEFGNWLKLNE